ncbi:MAG: VCBS repeat-containing protein [Alphaproteobacteria bacterium]|nr:VCBS repeat-containing protein [Alphaproteobacteria bacterium]
MTDTQSDLVDADGDGFSPPADCDDADPAIHPGAVEVWYDGVDTDCDGADDYDQDGDGDRPQSAGGLDCDDTDPTVTAATDTCTCGNGVLEPGEACDGPSTATWSCDADCAGPCGDGVAAPGEICLRSLQSGPGSEIRGLIDVTGDGVRDLLVYDGGLVVRVGAGDGTFPVVEVLPPDFAQGNSAVGDFDGDGRPDLLMSVAPHGTAVVSRDSTGAWAAAPAITPTVGHLAAADFDSDGDLDFIVSESTGSWESLSGVLHLFLGDAQGFTAAGTVQLDGSGIFPVPPADRDLDGRPETVVSWSGFSASGQEVVRVDNGALVTAPFVGPSVFGAFSADLDQDGCEDVVFGNVRRFRPCGAAFATGPTFQIPAAGAFLSAGGDFDGDGDVDLFGSDASGDPAVWHADGGAFTRVPLPLSEYNWVATGDVDGQGSDAIALGSVSGTFRIARWDP